MPVCPMALLVFIDFFTELKALVRGACSRLRGRSRRSPGLSPWQPPLAPISRRCLPARQRVSEDLGKPSRPAKPSPAVKACPGLQKLAPALGDTFWRLGREVVARARALATVLTLLSICSRRDPKRRLELGEEVDEDKERRGADWQGTKQPSQLALTPSMNAIRAG